MSSYRPPQLRTAGPLLHKDIHDGLTLSLGTIDGGQLPAVDDTEFKDVELGGGYNWIDSEDNAIVTPGLPGLWTDKTGRLGRLKSDISINGPQEIVTHGFRVGQGVSILEPIFLALNSPSAMDGIELVTDRNSLRKIYGLFTPDAMCGRKPFRIDAQLVGDTVLFTRWENPAQLVRETHPMCFSKSHELATIKQQMADVTSCHRIVRYNFGGINLMVRFELDAVTSVQSDMPAPPHPLPESWEQVGNFKVYRTDHPSPPLSTFIEKKTRSMHGNLDYIDI